MSNPLNNTPGHSPIGEPAQDPQTGIILAGILSAPLPDEEIEAQKIEAQRHRPPQDGGDKFGIGSGRMAQDKRYPDDPSKGVQVPSTVRAGIITLHQLYEMIFRGRKICGKFDAPCIYAAVPRRRGCCKKTNVAFAQLVPVDLDGTIKDEKGLDRLRRWCRLFACILYSSARHNPKAGVYRLRILLPVNASMDLEEYRRVSKAICLQLAAYLGTSEGIDCCTEKAFQPMLIPGWSSQELADQAICELFDGDIMDVTVPLAAAKAEILELEAEKAAQHCARASMPRMNRSITSAQTAAALAGVDADGVDGLAGARADLDDLGPIGAGSGRSNRDLFKAATILRDWEIDLGDAIDEMRSRYPDQDPQWLEAKTRSAYDAGNGSPRTGWRHRAAVAEQVLTLGDVYDLEAQVVEPVAANGGAIHATPPFSGATDNNCTHGVVGSLRKAHPMCVTAGENEPRRTRREVHTARLHDLASFDLLPARVTGIKSPTGTCKNVHLKPAMVAALAATQTVITLAHRRSLTRGQGKVWGLPCYLDTKAPMITGSTTICLDSVHRLASGPVEIVVIDEAEQVFRHLFGATIRKRGQVGVVFCALRDLLRRAKKIVLLDADLTPLSMFYVRVLLGEDFDEQVIENLWRPSGRIRVRSRAGMFADLVAKIGKGERVWLYCTSRESAKTHAKRLKGMFKGIKLLLVHSQTTGLAECQAALEDPSKFGAYQVVIATPSVGTGVSVEHEAMWHVFGDCQSGCGSVAADVKQGLMRVRDPLSLTICVHGPRRYEQTNPEVVKAELLTLSERTRKRLRGQQWSAKYQHGITTKEIPIGEFTFSDSGENLPDVEVAKFDVDIIRIQAEVLADAAKQGNYLHDIEVKDKAGAWVETLPGALLVHLKGCGYRIDDIPDEIALDPKENAKEHKEAKKEVTDEWVESVMSAPDLTDGEAQAIEDAGASTPEAAANLARHKIKRFYGVSNPDRDLVARDDHGRRRGDMMVASQLLAFQRGESQAVDRLDRLDARSGVSAQLEHRAKKAQVAAGLWALFGITDLEADGKAGTVLKDPGDIGDIGDIGKNAALRKEVKRYLRITLKPGASAFLAARALAAKVGIELDPRPVTRPDGSRGREYTLERDSVSLMVEDSSAYLGRLTDPAGRNADLLESEAGKKRGEELVAAILAA